MLSGVRKVAFCAAAGVPRAGQSFTPPSETLGATMPPSRMLVATDGRRSRVRREWRRASRVPEATPQGRRTCGRYLPPGCPSRRRCEKTPRTCSRRIKRPNAGGHVLCRWPATGSCHRSHPGGLELNSHGGNSCRRFRRACSCSCNWLAGLSATFQPPSSSRANRARLFPLRHKHEPANEQARHPMIRGVLVFCHPGLKESGHQNSA